MNRLGLTGAAALLVTSILVPAACGAPFTAGSAPGDDGGPTDDVTGADVTGGDVTVADGSSSGAPEASPDAPHQADAAGDVIIVPLEATTVDAVVPGSIVYVSTSTGNDSNDGTDPSKPKKTIAAALTRAQSITTPEVHVCKGTYAETSLVLSQTLRLLGSYDCTTWKRTASYGFPAFDNVNQVIVTNASPAAQSATLEVSGGVAPSAEIDGFTIVGAPQLAGTTVALATGGSASPVVHDCVIDGGGGTGDDTHAGSVGVAVLGGSPEVRASIVRGGSGKGNPGSNGVAILAGGTPYLHDAIVTGGTGTAASSTDVAATGIAVAVPMSQSNALKNLVVSATDASATVVGPSIGIEIAGSNIAVDVTASAVSGGTGTGAGTQSVAVEVSDPGGTVRILGDRLFGGVRTGGSSQTFGLAVAQSGVLDVYDCEIHAGEATATGGAGVDVAGTTAPSIAFDTIYGGPVGYDVLLDSSVTSAVIVDDLLAGSDGSAAAVSLTGCTGKQVTQLSNTAFVNSQVLFACGTAVATTPALIATDLPNASTGGNVLVGSGTQCLAAASCVSDSSCPNASTTCLPTVFGPSFTTTDDGFGGLWGTGATASPDASAPTAGWTLALPTWCAVARGGIAYASVSTDIFGAPRSNTPTMGAVEATGNCK